MPQPRMSVVVLTWNEERSIAACLGSLAAQSEQLIEVIVVDAASTDGTVAAVRAAQRSFPVPLRLVDAPHRLPIGEARNLGVAVARADAVAFLSADAELDPNWAARALQALEGHDMAFSRQVHAPRRWGVGAAVRGLRYAFPESRVEQPLRYASNVAAAYRKNILLQHPFDPWANAAEDLLLARRAVRDGASATYDPALVVHHHDVGSARAELRKNLREGIGCAMYASTIGWPAHASWGIALAALLLLVVAFPTPAALLALMVLLWLPTLRRALRPHKGMPAMARVLGVLLSPIFDLVFLAGLVAGATSRAPGGPQETPGPEPGH
ncbi:MAG: glycosyltransferase [bacterium]